MIYTIISSSNPEEVGMALAASKGCEHISLKPYIEHKIGQSIEEIKTESEERYRAIEAEAVRDVVMMREVISDDLVFSLSKSTFEVPVLRELIEKKSTEIIDAD